MTLVLVVLVALFAWPAQVMACTCADLAEGEVVFVGTATNGPGSVFAALAPAMFSHSAGTYTFAVDEVRLGDASDARVFTPSGGGECGRDFVIGAKYEVHANYGDYWMGGHTFDAPLVTTICQQGSELEPASALGFLSYRPTPVGLAISGLLALAAAVAFRNRARLSLRR
jgi:hypothetical protein